MPITFAARRAIRIPLLRKAAVALLALGAACGAGAAKAEIIQIPGPAFVEQCPCDAEPAGEVQNGVLVTTGMNATYFAAVPFPDKGLRVCSLSLVYRDVNGNDDMTARLLRKPYATGGKATKKPVVMATVQSTGNQNEIRIADTSNIKSPKLSLDDAFYYVEVDVVTINLDFLGVKIDVRKECP